MRCPRQLHQNLLLHLMNSLRGPPFRPPSNIEEFVSFGHEEGDDAMSISASEKEDWAGSEPDHLDSSEPSYLQEELMRVLSKAVQELELTWSPPEEPVRSKLDSWYFRSTRKADSRPRFLSSPTYTSSCEDVAGERCARECQLRDCGRNLRPDGT